VVVQKLKKLVKVKNNMDIITFVTTINKLRLKKKNQWYFWSGKVNGKSVQIKGYKTWLQIYKVDGIKIQTAMDIPVAKFKQVLIRGVR